MCLCMCVFMYNRNNFNSRNFTIVMCDDLTVVKFHLILLKLIIKLSVILKRIIKNVCNNNLVNSHCLYNLR